MITKSLKTQFMVFLRPKIKYQYSRNYENVLNKIYTMKNFTPNVELVINI